MPITICAWNNTIIDFIVSPAEYRELNGLMFGMSCMGMVSPFPDVYNDFYCLQKMQIKKRQ